MKTIGILGLGSIGMVHARNLIDMGHKVIGYDPNPLREHAFEKLGGKVVNSDDIFDVDKDAVVIASPSSTHAHTMEYFERTHMLIEKPLATSQEDYELITKNFNRGNLLRVVMTGNNLRFHDCVQKAREWLPSIGKPLWANFTVAQYNDRPQYLRDGVTLNWGAHEMDLALYLLGPAEVVAAAASREDDIADIIMLHESGCRTIIHLDYLTKNQVRTFLIQGTENMVAANVGIGYASSARDEVFEAGHDWNETYVREMKAFLDRIDGKPSWLTTAGATGEDGLYCLRLLLDAKNKAGI